MTTNTQYFKKEDLSENNLQKIADFLKEGKLVIFPTETVYGLGAHVFNESAIDQVYELKKRSKTKSLIVHLGKIEDTLKVAKDIPDEFYLLAEKFFPGPLTLILKKKQNLPKSISHNDTIAVRMPNENTTRTIINLVGDPIVGTSANISNNKNPISADEVISDFNNKVAAIVDTGRCPIGVPSTIVTLQDNSLDILREGIISKEEIEDILKKKL